MEKRELRRREMGLIIFLPFLNPVHCRVRHRTCWRQREQQYCLKNGDPGEKLRGKSWSNDGL
jgi:hypothetical protein